MVSITTGNECIISNRKTIVSESQTSHDRVIVFQTGYMHYVAFKKGFAAVLIKKIEYFTIFS